MILSTYIECPACSTAIILRVGISRARQKFTVACPECRSSIRGDTIPDGSEHLDFNIPGVTVLDPEVEDRDWRTVSTYGDLPIAPSGEFSSFLFATSVLGEKFATYRRCVAIVRDFEEKVDPLEHAYGFYLQGKWELLDSVVKRHFSKAWPDDPTILDRHTYLHRILSWLQSAVEPAGQHVQAKREIWQKAGASEERFAKLAFSVISNPGFSVVNRRVSDQFFSLLRDGEEWVSALAIVHLRAAGKSIPAEWRIPPGRIGTLRDAYRQNFEVSCQMLPVVIRMQNMCEGRDPEVIRDPAISGGWAPRSLRPQELVNNMNQFSKVNAATKEAYLNRNSKLRSFWNSAFSRDVRNSIAHAEFDYVMHDGILEYKGRRVPFHVFVEALIKQIALLIFWLDLCKLCKIYGSRWDPATGSFLGLD
ncbi:hypothetical protein [Streptomyces wedmorensis]